MILNYLLAFSLLVTSVIKVSDLFIHANKDLDAKRMEFIKETKKTHEEGSITLMGMLLTLMISALLLFFATKFSIELKEARYRKDSYLCFKYLNVTTENYISDMTKINWGLRAAYAAMSAGFAPAAAAFEGLKIAQGLRHVAHIGLLLKNNYCPGSLSSASYLKNLPYETNGLIVLNTMIDGTSIIRSNKWVSTYYKNPKGIRLKNSFCLKAHMEMENDFFPNLKMKTEEISMAGFSKLKCLSSFQ